MTKRFFPGEWADMPGTGRDAPTYFAPVGTIKAPPPVHPHTSYGRSFTNTRCRQCAKSVGLVHRADGGTVFLDWECAVEGSYVLELDPHRQPMAAPYELQHHDGWARYREHVCKQEEGA